MTGTRVEVAAERDGEPPVVAVRDSAGVLRYSGPLPPFGAALPSATPRLPGVDFDVVLRLEHAHLGEVVWTMQVRDGIEIDPTAAPAPRHLELAMPYAWALRMLYDAVPFSEYLDAATAAAHFDQLSCLAGLVYVPGAARRHRLPAEVVDALEAWSRGEGGPLRP